MTVPGDGTPAVASNSALRLDLLTNPYGPSARARRAMLCATHVDRPEIRSQAHLRERVARFEDVPAEWIVLGAGMESLVEALCRWRAPIGPLILFDPTDFGFEHAAARNQTSVEHLSRSVQFQVEIDPSVLPFFTPGAAAVVMSPNDPTGTLLAVPDAVRLSRGCDVLVIDERHGGYGPRSLLPLAREFDNIVVLKTLETWAGLQSFPVAYAIARPRIAIEIARHLGDDNLSPIALLAAEATFDDLPDMLATVDRVRDERNRLFRMLRKLNVVQPVWSTSNFVLTKVVRGDPRQIQRGLLERGIVVARPPHPALQSYFRISALDPCATRCLKDALIEIAARIP